MSVSSISGATQTYETTTAAASATAAKEAQQKETAATEKNTTDEVVYEKGDSKKKDTANQIYNRDSVISKLKADQKSRAESMRSLVEKLLSKQTNKFSIANQSLSSIFGEAAKNADPATIKKAQEDISEDGYWGVKQTSQRIFDFAKALAGDDPEKMKEMQAAVEKGFKQAEDAWGGSLPSICGDTHTAIGKLFDDYYAETGATA